MNRKALISVLFLGLVAAILAGGCNSNPVATSQGSDTLLGYSQDGRIAESNSVDILWVIDNSGSMGDEQVALLQNFQRFVGGLAKTKIDFQMAVTTTEAGGRMAQLKPYDTKFYEKGELRTMPNPIPGPLAWSNFSIEPGTKNKPADKDWVKTVTASYEGTARAAWKCSKAKLSEAQLDAKIAGIKDAINKVVEDAYDNNHDKVRSPDITAFFPGYDVNSKYKPGSTKPDEKYPYVKDASTEYREFPAIISSASPLYNPPGGKLDIKKLIDDFSCIALVGTEGSGVEKGLQALDEATDIAAMKRTSNRALIRSKSKFAAIFVTDENDCTHAGTVDFNDTACESKVCNLFNAVDKIPNNPMIPVEDIKQKLVGNLRAAKKDNEFNDDNVIVASITAYPKREKRKETPGFTISDQEIIDHIYGKTTVDASICDKLPFFTTSKESAQAMDTCTGYSGIGYNGDRYIRFARLFQNHYPPAATNQKPGEKNPAEGVICAGSFGNALGAIAKLFDIAASGCISQKLFGGCGAGVGEKTPCGSEAYPSKCVKVEDGSYTYCPSAIKVVAVSKDSAGEARLDKSGYCKEGTMGNVEGFGSGACILNTDKYKFVACANNVDGIKFEFKDFPESQTALAGIDVQVMYSAFAPEDD